MEPLIVIVATVIHTVFIAVVVRRLLGVAVGWPRTLLLSAMATSLASAPLAWAFDWLGVGAPSETADPGATSAVAILLIAWVLALEISILAIAEAIVPTGTLPGPLDLVRGLPAWLRRTRRYLGILGIAARHGLIRYLGPSRPVAPDDPDRPRDTAVALRQALTQAGVTFVKLGQMLGTRPDLLPPRYIDELSRLHSQVPPQGWPLVEATLRDELGADPHTVFGDIEHTPLAAASVGQVHCATLRTGEDVVVKVQRTGARAMVRGDVDIIARLAASTERRTSWARRLGTVDLADGFRRSLDEELDYRVELHNLEALRGSETIVIPRGYPQYSTPRVLTMDRLVGVPLSGAAREIAALSPQARRDLAEGLLDLVLLQMFVDGVFHADLHGGNVLLLSDGRLALLDFGAVGRLDRGARSALTALLTAVDGQDGAAASAQLVRLLEAPDDLDVSALEREVADLVMRAPSLPVDELFGRLFAVAIRYRLRVPPPAAAAFRAIAALEGTLRLLSPDIDIIALARARAAAVVGTSLRPRELADAARGQLVTTMPALARLPEQVASVVDRLDRPHFGIRPALAVDAPTERFLSGLVQQVVIAVLAATSAACGTALTLSSRGPMVAPRLALSTYVGLVLLLFAYVLGSRLVGLAFRVRHETQTEQLRSR